MNISPTPIESILFQLNFNFDHFNQKHPFLTNCDWWAGNFLILTGQNANPSVDAAPF